MILIFLSGTTGCFHYASLPPMVKTDNKGSLLITKARIFDGNADHPIQENMDVLVTDGQISRIAPHPLGVKADTEINAEGMLIMPGLIDFHTHVGGTDAPPWRKTFYPPERTLSAFLAFGVTSIVDLGGIAGQLQGLHEELESGEITGPRLAYAGPQVTVAESHPGPLIEETVNWPVSSLVKHLMIEEIDENTDFAEMAQNRIEEGASLVKIMIDRIPLDTPSMPPELAKRTVEAAHKAGLPVAAHIGTSKDLETALNAGVDLFAHSVNSSQLSTASLERLKSSGTPVISTMRIFQNVAMVSEGKNPVTAADATVMDSGAFEAFKESAEVSPSMQEYGENIARHTNDRLDGCIKMREADIPILIGTDTPLLGASAGASTHEEIFLLVERCGYSPAKTLAMATSQPGAILGNWLNLRGLGTISEGAPADLLIIAGDPTTDIGDLTKIDQIISRGNLIEPAIPAQD
ncbi:amidohydrolase family protein [Hahella ganghwensis]|uniref:amidohydrolase family protein n=1 Tax=Hahella ganghwensis TaxID=286420 RepID=UPI00035ECEB5|nr:amidohydrolase family protein [Hahella ganghwensis]